MYVLLWKDDDGVPDCDVFEDTAPALVGVDLDVLRRALELTGTAIPLGDGLWVRHVLRNPYGTAAQRRAVERAQRLSEQPA